MSNIPSANTSTSHMPAAVSASVGTATPSPATSTSAAKATAAGNLSATSQITARPTTVEVTQQSMSSKRPVLEEPKSVQISGEALNTLLTLLANTSTDILFKNAGTALDGVGKQLKAENEKRANEDKKAQEAALNSQNLGFWSKLWGYVSKVASVIAAVAITAVTGGAAFGVAVVMAASAVAGLVKSILQDAGAKWAESLPTSLGDIYAKGLEAVGVSKEVAGYIGMGYDISLAIAGLGLGGAGLRNAIKGVQSTAQKVMSQKRLVMANSISAVTSVAAGGSQIGMGIQSAKIGESNAQAQTAQAASKEIQTMTSKLQTLFTQSTDEVNQIQQTAQSLAQLVSDLMGSQKRTSDQVAKNINIA